MDTPEFLTAPGFGANGVVHAFTTRRGGVSTGAYESLNLGWRGDDAANVETNRRRVIAALGVSTLVFADQVHGDGVIRVDAAPDTGWSAGPGDALITNAPGLALCAQTADCVPILLRDAAQGAVAAIHSGWRGTVRNIVSATLGAMARAYGTDPANVHAVVGPSISMSHYRVGPEVVTQFETLLSEDVSDVMSERDADGGAQLDVAAACMLQLAQAGVHPERVHRVNRCTYDESRVFFSSRRAASEGRQGVFGGQCGIIALA